MSDEGDSKIPQPPATPPSMRRLSETAKPARRKRKEAALVAPPESPQVAVPEALQAAQDTHEWKMGLVGGRGVSGKSEDEIKKWADRRAVEMLPMVIADLHFDLKYGDNKARAEARDRILDMHGLRKREAAAGNHATIVLNLGGAEGALKQSLPWLSRSDKASEDEE